MTRRRATAVHFTSAYPPTTFPERGRERDPKPDAWDAKAAELLMCDCPMTIIQEGVMFHRGTCRFHLRPAVAALAREAYQQGTDDGRQLQEQDKLDMMLNEGNDL